MGVFGLALMNSPTVGKALDLWLQYAPVLAPSWDLSLSIEPPRAFLLAREWIPRRPVEVYATELLLSASDTIGRQLFGGLLPVRRVHLAYARPPHAERYREFYDVSTSFNQRVTAIEFDASLLEAPILCTDLATSRLAHWYCAEQLSLDATPEGLVGRVRVLLATAVGSPPDLEQLARTLQISTRTLRRSLQQMSTSYRQLLEESRARAETSGGAHAALGRGDGRALRVSRRQEFSARVQELDQRNPRQLTANGVAKAPRLRALWEHLARKPSMHS